MKTIIYRNAENTLCATVRGQADKWTVTLWAPRATLPFEVTTFEKEDAAKAFALAACATLTPRKAA